MKNLGIILIIIGVAATAFSGFTIITKKKVVDLGSVEINREEKTPVYWSPLIGMAILIVGVIVFVKDKKN